MTQREVAQNILKVLLRSPGQLGPTFVQHALLILKISNLPIEHTACSGVLGLIEFNSEQF